ncbi:MAG: hypothetical protein ACFCUU_15465 [Cyclobacteriaceae bacterium]
MFKESEFEGIVENKYIRKSSHGIQVIEIIKIDLEVQKISIYGARNDLLKYISKGDLIQKDKNTYEVKIIKGKEKPILFKIEFDCPE